MVVSMDDSKLFVSGGIESTNYRPRILAIDFSSSLAKIDDICLDEESFSVIWCMERYPNSDILFAGSFGGVAIVLFNGLKFETFGILKGKSDIDRFVDMHFVDKALFCIDEPSQVLYKFDYTDNSQQDNQYRSNQLEVSKLKLLSSEYDRPTKEQHVLKGIHM